MNSQHHHGGKRTGAGRKPTGRTRVQLTIQLPVELLKRLDATVPPGFRSKFITEAVEAKMRRAATNTKKEINYYDHH